jgi:hypothetical protein
MSDDFSVTEHIDSKSGLPHRIYKYKRKECRRVLLNSRLCSQLAGYTLIEKDLRSVLVWLHEIEARHTDGTSRKIEHFARSSDRTTYNLIKGLFVATLTFYGKCFSKCEGRPVKLERAQLDERFYRLHDECIAYRHNFAAHSGAKKLEHVEIVLVSPARHKDKIPFKVYRELFQPDLFWPSSGEITLIELVEHVRSIANAKIDLLAEKIQREEIIPNAKKYWSAK